MKAFIVGTALLTACSTEAVRPMTAHVKASWQPEALHAALPDFSYSGYRWGESPLPELSPTAPARAFGAIPDDGQDDTAGLQKALSTSGIVKLEPGRYEISDVVFLDRSNVVLQGSGSGAGGTVLAVTRPLAEMTQPKVLRELVKYLRDNNKLVHGKPFSPYSWTGGVFWVGRAEPPPASTLVQASAGRRGAHELELAGALDLRPGARIELRWHNPFGKDSPVLKHLYGFDGPIVGERLTADPKETIASQAVTVTAVDGSRITLKEPLLHDVRADWAVEVARSERLEGIGIEHLAIEFPNVPYGGHHLESGYNGIYVTDVSHGFVRDVRFENADSAIVSDDADHVTLQDIVVGGREGHYGVHLGSVYGFLAKNFRIEADEAHSISFNTRCTGSVFVHGSMIRPKLDQHRGANHQNLFDDLHGVEDRETLELFEHGGADYWGPTAGAMNVFWNIALDLRGRQGGVTLKGVNDAGPAEIVGLHANVPLSLEYARATIEGLNRADIAVPSLYEYQLASRLGRQ